MIAWQSTPFLYTDTFTQKVEDYLLVYNPLSEKGITVLNKEAYFLFNLVDGKQTVWQIFEEAKKVDPNVDFNQIKKIFLDFEEAEIVYFDKPKIKKTNLLKKPKKLEVWFHITNQCNLRCTYCYVWKTTEKMNFELAKKSIKKIIDDAKKNGFKKILFKFAGGESILELKNILNLVDFARELGKNKEMELDFVLLSNGVLISEKVAKILKEKDLRVAVSLDGLEKYNDLQRVFPSGLGSFKFVEQGIENLLKAKVHFNITVTITKKNVENIPELTSYLLKRNIPFAFNFYRENPYVSEELEGDDKKLVFFLKKAYQIIYNNPPPYRIIDGLLDRVSFRKPHLYTCGVGQNYIVLKHDGKIVPCQMLLDKPIGSIDDKDVINTMKKTNSKSLKNLSVSKKSPCRQCQWRYICCGGCPLLTFSQKGGYTLNSPYCAVYKALIPEVLKIEAKRLIKYGGITVNPQ